MSHDKKKVAAVWWKVNQDKMITWKVKSWKGDFLLEKCDNDHHRRTMANKSHVKTNTIAKEKYIEKMTMRWY
jgi:hypothetical protein